VQLFVFSSQLMLTYLVAVRPFTTALLNGLEIFNEVIILGTGYCLILISDVNQDPDLRFNIGLGYITIVLACILGNWGVLVYKTISTIAGKIKEKCNRRKAKKENVTPIPSQQVQSVGATFDTEIPFKQS